MGFKFTPEGHLSKEYWEKVEKRKEAARAQARRLRKRVRKKVLAFLGNKCAKCGFTDWRALQIDHINGGGSKEIREYSKSSGRNEYYRKIMRDKDAHKKYQLLCANCNWIKRFTNNET